MSAAGPELLSVRQAPPLVLVCAGGELQIDHDAASVSLDSGEPVSAWELADASRRYWEGWAARGQAMQ